MNEKLHYRALIRFTSALSCVCAAALVSSCGGGTLFAGGVDSGGTGRSTTSGSVTGLGSAYINGVRFFVDSAEVRDDDGNIVTPDQLTMGMVATIQSAAAASPPDELNAIAETIQIISQLVGPIEAVDLGTNTLTILGQTVRITPATWFDSAIQPGFTAGLVAASVEIYGHFDNNAKQYVATRVTLRNDHSTYKVNGLLNAWDPVKKTMVIGNLNVNYGTLAGTALPTTLKLGDFVRIRIAAKPVGTSVNALNVSVVIIDLGDARKVSLSGRITAWTSTRQFSVNGKQVNAASAKFPDGESGAILGARVYVSGISSHDALIASAVTVQGDETLSNSSFEVHGTIDALDKTAKSFVVHGITVNLNAQTVVQSGTISDLNKGRQVKVLGTLSTSKTSVEAKTIVFE